MSNPSQPSWQPRPGQGVPQPWQGPGAPQQRPGHHGVPAGPSSMLASHADRERSVDVLRAGFAEGRLEHSEFDKRVARAYAARTVGELALLVADLPKGPGEAAGAVPQAFQPVVPPRRINGKAVGACVCGVLCLPTMGLTGIPAVVLGHAARAELHRTGEGGDGLAMTGLVLGWLSTGGWAAVLVLAMVASIVSH